MGFFMGIEFPEAELVRNTFIIREMDIPPNIHLTRRSMLRWFALAFGLISENESRSTILDVLDAVFYYNFTKKANPTTVEIQEFLKEKNKPVSDKLLRYHVKRLINSGLIQRKKLRYYFNSAPHAEKQDIRAGFSHHVSGKVAKSLNELETMLEKLAENYRQV
ncbi:MAG: hypothetical protein HYW50_00900 [Candidatus Diapherotrites archaeon]|nr:hypothetical protein [Candidatus Diapherotrites archaeon]